MTVGTLTYQGELVSCTCWCGIHLAIPQQLYTAMQDSTRQNAHCPLGHTFVFSENENTKLKRQLRNANETADRERRWRETAERQVAAQKGVATKLRKRIVAGACPFGCKRHFVNLERHIATKHPGQQLEGE